MLLGAHVSTAGGIQNAPGQALQIAATAIQIFTKMPNRWAEKPIGTEEARQFRAGCREVGVRFACSHDSYLINLATADPVLRDRSYASFRSELERSRDLGLDAMVTHPGNATDGDFERGLVQNAALIQRALEETGDGPMILLETTAGAGHVLGATFEQLARIREGVASSLRHRIGVCMDTCHVFVAGYDLRDDYQGVMTEFEAAIGLEQLRLFHLNDSVAGLGSRRDRHAHIGAGMLGDEPFRRIMCDPRFANVPKVLETPKGEKEERPRLDRENLARLRSYVDARQTERQTPHV